MALALKGQTKVTVAIKVKKSYLSPFLFNSLRIFGVASSHTNMIAMHLTLCLGSQGQHY